MADTQPVVPSYSLITTSLLVNSIVFFILATLAVALRIYARKIKSLPLKWDDWTIMFSLLMSLAYSINTWVAADIGGVDTTTLSPPKAAEVFFRCLWIEGLPLGICLASIKISILLFYRRIFVTKIFKRWIDVMTVVLIGWAVSTIIALCLVADPISGAWEGGNLKYDFNAFSLAVAGMSIMFDLMVLCFPLPMIRSLKMPTRRKVQIAGIFWLGGFCCIAASIRFYYLYQSNHQVLTGPRPNMFYNATRGFIWAHIEPNCSIVAACLPTYGPLFMENKNLAGWWASFRSFISLGSSQASSSYGLRARAGVKEKPGAASDSGLPLDSKGSRHWQKLGKSDVTVNDTSNVVNITGDTRSEEHDLEAQHNGPEALRINVKRGFGAEY